MLRNIYEVSLVLVVFLFYSCGAISDSYKSHIDEEYIPRNLNDAVSELDKYINDSIKIAIRQMSEEDFLNESHFGRSEEHTSELQSRPHLVCRLLLEKKNTNKHQ